MPLRNMHAVINYVLCAVCLIMLGATLLGAPQWVPAILVVLGIALVALDWLLARRARQRERRTLHSL